MAWTDPADDAAWAVAVMRTVVEATGCDPQTMVMADEVIHALGGDPESFEEVLPGVRVLHGPADG